MKNDFLLKKIIIFNHMKRTPLQELIEFEQFLTDSMESDTRVASAMLKYIREFREVLLEREKKKLENKNDCDQLNKPVTRFEVIDSQGRVYTKWNCGIELHYQDDGRTLKVFVNEKNK